MKQIILVTLLVVGIIAGAVILGGGDDEAAGAPSNNFYGLESSEVVITEYGDFECPACAQFYPIISQVKEDFQDRVKFEFKHFPLVQIHPNAVAAHRAAEAAAKQGQFWEMHDLLYERQNSWRSTGGVHSGGGSPAETFEGYARELGLDIEQYTADVSATETIGTVNADIAEGRDIGAESTPTFLLNGEIIADINQLATVDGFTTFLEETLGNSSETESEQATEETKPEEESSGDETTSEESTN